MNMSIPILFHIDLTCATSACGDILSCLANWVTAITAIVAFYLSCKEYSNHLKRERANVLSRFNERYSDDVSIKKVICHINAIAYNTNSNAENREKPEVYDIEMFMRFFEELEYSIQSDNLDKKIVRDLFGFYPLLASERKDFLYEEDDKENWKLFNHFVKRMNRIKPLSKKDKGNFPYT